MGLYVTDPNGKLVKIAGGIGTSILIDTKLDENSVNPVQNRVITRAINTKANQSTVDELIQTVNNKADTSYVDQKVADLVGSAPDTLDTLDELANALKDNANIVTVLENSIANKADKSSVVDLTSLQWIDGIKAFNKDTYLKDTVSSYLDNPTTATYRSLIFQGKDNKEIAKMFTQVGNGWNGLNLQLRDKNFNAGALEFVADTAGWRFDPVQHDTVSLGTNARRWKRLYLSGMAQIAGDINGASNVNVSKNLNLTGDANITGRVNLASTHGNYPHITGDGVIAMSANGTYDDTDGCYVFEPSTFRPASHRTNDQDIGTTYSRWRDLHLGRNFYDYGARARAGRYSSETGTYYFEVARCLVTVDGYRGCMAKFEAQDFDQPQKCVVEVQTYKGALTGVPQVTIAVTDTSGGGSNTRWQNRFYIVANYVTDGTNVTSNKVLYQIFYKTITQYEAIHCKFTHECADYRDAKPTFWTKFENTTTATGTTSIPNNFTYKDIDASLTSGTVKQVIATDNLLRDLGTGTSRIRDIYVSGNISNGTSSVSVNNLITNTTFTTGTGTLNSTFVQSGSVTWIKVGRLVVVNISDMKLHKGKAMKHLDAYVTGLPRAGASAGKIINIFPYPAGTLGHNRAAIVENSTSLVNWYDDFTSSDGAGYFGVFAYYVD